METMPTILETISETLPPETIPTILETIAETLPPETIPTIIETLPESVPEAIPQVIEIVEATDYSAVLQSLLGSVQNMEYFLMLIAAFSLFAVVVCLCYFCYKFFKIFF